MNHIIEHEPDDVVETECPLCSGEGIVDYYVSGINYYNGSLIEHWRTCPQCKGSGTEWAASVPATEQEIMEPSDYDPTTQPYDEPLRHAPCQHDFEAEDDKGWRCKLCGHQT